MSEILLPKSGGEWAVAGIAVLLQAALALSIAVPVGIPGWAAFTAMCILAFISPKAVLDKALASRAQGGS